MISVKKAPRPMRTHFSVVLFLDGAGGGTGEATQSGYSKGRGKQKRAPRRAPAPARLSDRHNLSAPTKWSCAWQ